VSDIRLFSGSVVQRVVLFCNHGYCGIMSVCVMLESYKFYMLCSSDMCGHFDCIWDKHSFSAIDLTDREK